jgi:hypothetical protein
MAREVGTQAAGLAARAQGWQAHYREAEQALVATARRCVASVSDAELVSIAGSVPGGQERRKP